MNTNPNQNGTNVVNPTVVANPNQNPEEKKMDEVIENPVENVVEEVHAEENVLNVDDEGKLETFTLDDMNLDDLDELDDLDLDEDTGVVEASEDLSLATGQYIWYISEPIASTFKWITKNVDGKIKPVKLYSAACMVRVVFDIANNQPVNEGFLQNFYFYGKDGKPNRMGLAQAKQFSTSVLAAYNDATREEVAQMLKEDKVGNLQLFRDLLPSPEDDKKYVVSKIVRKEGKGDYKGTFSNEVRGVIKDASELYESLNPDA